MTRLELRIHGQVQRVGFRWAAKAEADRLGLVGYAANRTDGSVELVAEGEEPRLRELLHWAHAGPDWAKVTSVDERWQPPTGEFTAFEIRL